MGSPYDEIFAIGDIHGCARELQKLLEVLPYTDNSLIVFLGDYVDRGPHSSTVIDIIINLKKTANVITLMGNHESMFLDFLREPHSAAAGRFIFNGGGATLASYGDDSGGYIIPESHSQFLGQLLPFYETEEYFFVHAGVPDIALSEIDVRKHGSYLLWAREPFLSSDFPWKKIIVHGHTPVKDVSIFSHRINLDTGCVFNHRLSAIRLSDRKIFNVEKIKDPAKAILKDDSSERRGVRFKGAIPIQVFHNSTAIALETLDYNEFGFFAVDFSQDKSLRLKENEIIDIKINTSPNAITSHKGKVLRVKKEKEGIYYAVKFLENAIVKDN
ncbi:MAG: metallophosphoesterase family protein [Bdellovibrionota bacterium]